MDRAADVIRALSAHSDLLAQYGISSEEYSSALPAAIETLRGRMSASNASRRQFLSGVLAHLVDRGLATSMSTPAYGDDTVYRLDVPSIGAVAIIQKGCPDGAHSSVRWSAPPWAQETYLWWLCPSLKAHPGEHVSKGVNRLRQRFFSDAPDSLSGIIFHNELCGTAQRPCPKQSKSVEIGGQLVPAPCVYTMPERDGEASSWNWGGDRSLKFPVILLQAFGVTPAETESFTGFVGFQRKANGTLRTTITTRYGAARSSTFRN
ncbi:hypothetical protein [Microbacterium sp. 69-10]|uniref:hypothetical protein n=1 Tax=Microbacterium sp. 69-10 TaxID=1895783 RepID=UPI0025E102ED|nr:hypothetical protein [Microbacterium sp. 69-10]